MADGEPPAGFGEAPAAAAPPLSPAPAPAPTPEPARLRTRYARLESVVRQLGAALLTLLVISVVTFAATNIKDPVEVARGALGREATEAQLQAYSEKHGLDKPVYVRYGNWLGDFVRGDWGTSPVTDRGVRDEVLPRLEKTLLLSVVALLVALPISVLVGLY